MRDFRDETEREDRTMGREHPCRLVESRAGGSEWAKVLREMEEYVKEKS